MEVNPRMSLNKIVTGFFCPRKDSSNERCVLENRLRDIFGNVTTEHVAITHPLELFQRVLEDDAERAGNDETEKRLHHRQHKFVMRERNLAAQ